jgi:hypothetical protein
MNANCDTTHVKPRRADAHSLPLLDIEELLALRPWQRRPLEGSERHLLREVREFLTTVEKGKQILERAAEGEITTDSNSLRAYNYFRRAVDSAMLIPACSPAERHRILDGMVQEIDRVLKEDPAQDRGDIESADLASEFFQLLVEDTRK